MLHDAADRFHSAFIRALQIFNNNLLRRTLHSFRFGFIVIFYLQKRFGAMQGVSISHRNSALPPGTANNRQEKQRETY